MLHTTVFTGWHRIADDKLHYSPNHALCHMRNSSLSKWRCGDPAGHPKQLQLETPLLVGGLIVTAFMDVVYAFSFGATLSFLQTVHMLQILHITYN